MYKGIDNYLMPCQLPMQDTQLCHKKFGHDPQHMEKKEQQILQESVKCINLYLLGFITWKMGCTNGSCFIFNVSFFLDFSVFCSFFCSCKTCTFFTITVQQSICHLSRNLLKATPKINYHKIITSVNMLSHKHL